jgi:iron complex outermembrane receptor protein
MPASSLRPVRLATASAGFFGAVLITAAQAATPEIEEIRVLGSSLDARLGRISHVSVLSAEEVQRVGAVHPDELFRRVPAVWVSRGSGQEHLTAIRSPVLTGAGACGAFQFLEDGMSIRPGGFCNVNNLFELMFDGAAQVEVARGPSGAEYGGNALNGVINVRTRVPEPGARLRIEGGSWAYGRLFTEVGGSAGDVALGLQYAGVTSGGYRDDTGFGDSRLRLAASGNAGAWTWNARVTGTLLEQETGGFVRGEDAYKDDVLRRTNPNPEAYRDAWSLRGSVVAERSVAQGVLSVSTIARRSQMEFLQHFLPGQPLEQNAQTSFGIRPELSGTAAWGQWTLGALVDVSDTALFQVQEQVSFPSRPVGVHYDYRVEGLTTAAFAGAVLPVSPRLDVLANLRVERQGYDYENRGLDGNTRDDGTPCPGSGCLFTRPADRSDSFTELGYRLGLRFEATDAVALFTNVGRGFRPPQSTELYRLQSGQTVADLAPERLDSIEAGTTWTPDDGARVRVDLTLFAQRKRDQILRDANGFNISAGRTRGYGAELVGRFVVNDAHDFAADVGWARHSYDFNRALSAGESITAGDPVDTAPELLASVRWRYRPFTTVESELELYYLDGYSANASNTAFYPGHTVVNWRLAWAPAPQLRFTARVMNLLDRKYADRADFAFGSYRYFPAEPRAFFAGMEYSF